MISWALAQQTHAYVNNLNTAASLSLHTGSAYSVPSAPLKASGACGSACWAGPQTRTHKKTVLLREKASKKVDP